MKKIIAIALCLILCLSLLPMAAMADEEQITVHVKVPTFWSAAHIWAWVENGNDDQPIFESVGWPGPAMSQSGDWYTMNVPGSATGVLINGGSDANKTQDMQMEAGKDVWIVVDDSNQGTVYYSEADAKNHSSSPAPAPAASAYYVVGSGSLFSAEWSANDDGLMTKNADGSWTKSYTVSADGEIKLKVHSPEDNGWYGDDSGNGDGDGNYVINATKGMTITVTYSNGVATVTTTGGGNGGNTGGTTGGNTAPANATYHVVGSGSIFSSEWTPTDDNLMTKNADGTYSKTYTNVSAGTLGIKVMRNSSEWIPDGMGNETIVEVPTGGSTVVVTFDPATSAITAQVTEGGEAAPDTNAENITVYAKVPGNWESPCIWAWSDGVGDAFSDIGWPGQSLTLDGEWYKMSVPGWVTGVIINAGGGTIQTSDLIVEAGKDLWIVVDNAGVGTVYYEEPTDLDQPTEPTTAPTPTEPSDADEKPGSIAGPIAAVVSCLVVVIIGVGVLMVLRKKKLSAQAEETEEVPESQEQPEETAVEE